MLEATGRNDLCPCGSGKKYKKCCLLNEQTRRPLSRTLLGQASQKAFNELLKFSGESDGVPTVPEDLPRLSLIDKNQVDGLFHVLILPWLFYQQHPQKPETLDGPSEETVVANCLRQRGASLDGMTRRYMDAARSEPFSFWQVLESSPNSGLLLKDMITGDERFVADVSLSRSVVRWDILFAQTVGLDGLYIVNATGIFAMKPSQFGRVATEFSELLRQPDGALPDRPCLFRYQHSFLRHYLESVQDMMNAPPPEIRNMDGDKLARVTSIYAFDPKRRNEVIAALAALDDMNSEGEEDGKTCVAWLAMPKSPGHKDKVLKARILVGSEQLESECNSEKRDKTLRRRLLKALDALLSHESTTLKPFRPGPDSMKPSRAGRHPTGSLDLARLSEEDEKQVEDQLGQQFMAWADTEIPALNGKTPRQMVRTKTGKEKIAGMINEWENMSGHVGEDAIYRFDFNRLRAELKIPEE
jgi:hypothetical protein